MNEKIAQGQEMILANNSIETVISTIMEHALFTRPQKQVYYRPYQACKGVGFTRTLSSQLVNLAEIYPDAQVGDGVFADFHIVCEADETIYLNVSPNVKVWYNTECIYDGIDGGINSGEALPGKEDGRVHLPICVKKDAVNAARILCVKEADRDFSYEFLISVKRYPFMWANDYLFWARSVLPIAERAGEDGVALSGLMKKDTYEQDNIGTAELSYQWPPALSKEEAFDFKALCGEGDVCYVYTEAVCDHELAYTGTVERIWVNGEACCCDQNGAAQCCGEALENEAVCSCKCGASEGSISVKAGDKLLFRCKNTDAAWGLSLDTANLALPFLKSARGVGDKAIFAGPFYGTQCHAPEYDWDFSKVFMNGKGEQLYWSFCDGSELRIYLDSVFFGQWFYALMVGFYGIRDAAILLGDTKRQRLFNENMSMLAKYFDYVEYDIKKHVMSAFMPRLYEMDVLDNIGTMGMNLVDAYLDSNDRALLPIIERIRYQAEETIPRFEDGTYYRLDTMWADDLYMSCPFLVRMGRLTGDKTWFEKAAKQLAGFKKRLYMEDEHLFSHIFFPHTGLANRVPWGRGNGWVMWTLSEFLMHAEGHIDVSAEKQMFYDMAHALKGLQSESGLWRQVLNRDDEGSYIETSCTGMFLLAFTRGVKYGWLEKDFLDCMAKAWKGILTHSVDAEGNVYGVCMGSGCAMEAEYYFTIPTIINDDHGTGVILAAGAEYGALLRDLAE
ncbi:MAG: glycoside hydrolase family 88 protein [Lachnospiraceae bacterium]|nr:glycoside hydrolase family 88 protein [Lachnospiraceae bacterium]